MSQVEGEKHGEEILVVLDAEGYIRRTEQSTQAENSCNEETQEVAVVKIVSVVIVDTTEKSKTKASITSSVVRGTIGGLLLGPVGMVAGAVTPKKKTITETKTVTFAVLYADGTRRLETVKNGSARFKELAKYLA